MSSTVTVVSPVTYTQVEDGPIRDVAGRALIEGTSTHTLVAKIMDTAKAHAMAMGSIGVTLTETVHGVDIAAKWSSEDPFADDEPERDTLFSLDAVVAALHDKGIPAYCDMTGGGCATIFAGGRHVVRDGAEERIDWDVAAGPGTFNYREDSTALLEEFSVGPNDEGLSECVNLPDTVTTAAQAVAWAVAQIEAAVAETENRSFAQWNRRVCTACTTVVVPGPRGGWQALDLAPCQRTEDGKHTTVWL